MALSDDTHAWLDQEGLVTVGEFEDFKSNQLEKSIMNLCIDIPDMPDQWCSTGGILLPEGAFNHPTFTCIRKVHIKTSNHIT